IAFISARSGKPDLWMIPVTGGEAVQITDVKTGVAGFMWSPDGKSIGFLAPDPATPEKERAIKEKDDSQVVGEDIYVTGQPRTMNHIWTVSTEKNLTGYDLHRVTEGNFTVFSWDWSPDGSAIAFSHAVGPGADDYDAMSDISKVEINTGKITALADSKAPETSPMYSPDGKWIALCIGELPLSSFATDVFIMPTDGGEMRALARTPDQQPTLIGWSNDSRSIYFRECNGTTDLISALPIDGSAPVEISRRGGVIDSVALNSARSAFGFAFQNSSEPVEAYVSSIKPFNPKKVSNVNADLPTGLLGKTEVVSWNSTDGKKIEGLLTYPLGYVPGKRYPLLLIIHGGPASKLSQDFIGGSTFYPISTIYPYGTFSSQGYAILRPNPRGSGGYGAQFRRENIRDWGGLDYQGLMTGVDRLIDRGIADKDRLGVMGWSYGGFMSAWIIGHTDRFKASSVGAPVIDAISIDGTNDYQLMMPEYFGTEFWNDYQLYLAHSPIYYVKNVTTPTLIQQGGDDIRVPLTQGEEFYSALHKLGVNVKMVVYPRSGHEPEEPKLLRAVMRDNLEWFNRYLSAS
ncbi:MAG TPA: S9 family peptidase, partial [Methanotrichaceae archaeon]|nr:S9 family peptidase [Methanotrichaceae archaeon]